MRRANLDSRSHSLVFFVLLCVFRVIRGSVLSVTLARPRTAEERNHESHETHEATRTRKEGVFHPLDYFLAVLGRSAGIR